MRKLFGLLFLILAVINFGGCAATKPKYSVLIDSINNNEVLTNKKAIIVPAATEISPDDLQFMEFAKYVERSLASKGYEIVHDKGKADIAIVLGYGIGDPEEHVYTYNIPIIGQTGIASATTTGSTNSFGNLSAYGNHGSYSGNSSYSGTTTYTPSYGVVGSTTNVETVVTFTRYAVLNAYDIKASLDEKKPKQLWKTEIVSTGSSGDLRKVFPVLIGASLDYVGENTGKKIEVILDEDDEKVLNIKGVELVEKMK